MTTLMAPIILSQATFNDILLNLDHTLLENVATRFTEPDLEWETFLQGLELEVPALRSEICQVR